VLREKLRILVAAQISSGNLILMTPDTEGTFRPERIQQIAERFGGEHFRLLSTTQNTK
jgi:hypothetical protein